MRVRNGKGKKDVKQWESKRRAAILMSDKWTFSQNSSQETKKLTYYNKRAILS